MRRQVTHARGSRVAKGWEASIAKDEIRLKVRII